MYRNKDTGKSESAVIKSVYVTPTYALELGRDRSLCKATEEHLEQPNAASPVPSCGAALYTGTRALASLVMCASVTTHMF